MLITVPGAIIAAALRPSNARPKPVRVMRSTLQDILNPDPYDRAMSSPEQDDPPEIRHPLLQRLLVLWQTKCGDRMMPGRADFDVLELKDWLGNLILIDVLDGAAEFRYRLYGSVLASYYGRDLTGKLTAAMRPETRDLVRREYARVCAARHPMMIERKRSVKHSTRLVAKLILPLAADGVTVDMILVASYPL